MGKKFTDPLTYERVAARFFEMLSSHRTSWSEAIQNFSKALLDNFRTRLATDWRDRDHHIARANPLVLVLATGGASQIDIQLEICVPYWSNYTSALVGWKPSCLVVSFQQLDSLIAGMQLQKSLRGAFSKIVGDPPDPTHLDRVRDLRTALGSLVMTVLDGSALSTLGALGADRVVCFSDLLFDFVPVNGSIFCLEYPLTRLPNTGPGIEPIVIINNAAMSSAKRLGGSFTGGRAGILYPKNPTDQQEEWAKSTALAVADFVSLLGLSPLDLTSEYPSPENIFEAAETCQAVFFFGHAHSSEHWAGLRMSTAWLDAKHIRERNWLGKLIFLIGCETSAIDTQDGDLGRAFLRRGARAVIATTGRVSPRVADVFLKSLFQKFSTGIPLDYAFFLAKRHAVVVEALAAKTGDWEGAARLILENGDLATERFDLILGSAGLEWSEVYRSAVYSLTFNLLAGAGERLS